MRKRCYYNAATLRQELLAFEKRYGLSSADFYAAHRRGETPNTVSQFDRVVWADTYGESCRLAARVEPARSRRIVLQPAG